MNGSLATSSLGLGQAPLLNVEELRTYFPITRGLFNRTAGFIRAVDGISFSIRPNETLAIVGESGCGKTTIARSIVRLVEPTAGTIRFKEHDLATLSPGEMRRLRKDIQLIFQDPYSSLTPHMRVGQIVQEPMINFSLYSAKERQERVMYLLDKVGLSEDDTHKYPHEFSGGQRQRVAVSRALASNPQLIIADEPVSALDVSIQAQVLNLLVDIQDEFNVSYIFISHDLAVVEYISHRVAVMYLGSIVEIGSTDQIFDSPTHPYTRALLDSIPHPSPGGKKDTRFVLKGDIPSPANPPHGCLFVTRCPQAMRKCGKVRPELVEIEEGHFSACSLYE